MINKTKLFYILKLIVSSLLFYGAVMFENARGERLAILIAVFVIYLVVGILRKNIFTNNRLFVFSFILDIALIYILESNSRFQINYFFHSFYIFLLIEVALLLDRKYSLIIGIVTVLISTMKYVFLVYYIPNLVNISQMGFFTMISVFVLIITAFAQYYREEEQRKDELYKELLNTHKRLENYAEEVEKLTIIEERNRIARDIHDTLGHSMTGIIMQMEMAYHLMDDNIDDAKNLILKAKNSSRQGLIKIREVVETLRPNQEISTGIEALKELVDNFSDRTGVNIDLDIQGSIIKLNSRINIALYRLIQEAITNSVRHGKATNIEIKLKYTYKGLHFYILDNGVGCTKINDGFGLKGMKERVRDLNGSIEIESHDNFIVKGFIPIGGEKND